MMLMAATANAAYSVTNTIDEFGTATTTFTSASAYTFASNDRVEIVVLWFCTDTSRNPTGVTDTNSNAWSSVGAANIGSITGMCYQAWEAKKITTAGASHITVTFASSPTKAGMAGLGATGLSNTSSAQSANQAQTNPGTGAGAVTSGTITPASQPAFMMGLAQSTSGNFSTGMTPTAGTSHTLTNFITANTHAAAGLSDQRLTTLTTTAATFTDSNGAADTTTAFTVMVPESGGGPSASPSQFFLGASLWQRPVSLEAMAR